VTMNKANMGYIPAIVLSELKAGRKVEIVGACCTNVGSRADYDSRKDRLIGLFGEVIGWKSGGVTMVATRSISDCPDWVKKMIDDRAWDAPEMFRWQVPKEER